MFRAGVDMICFPKGVSFVMRFQARKNCDRPAWVQQIVDLVVRHLNWMPLEVHDEAYQLVGEIAGDPVDGRALWELLTRDITVEGIHMKYGVPISRLYKMRDEFFERFLSKTIRKR